MVHNRVDQIMKKVAEYYRGDFWVNNDWMYSQNLAKKYREQYANRFVGNNGMFNAARMSYTEGCLREEGKIRISAGGAVFGPYFAFSAGDYIAIYDLAGDLGRCTVEVGSQTIGSIASGNAKELLTDEKVTLKFSLPVEVGDLEFKVINNGKAEIIFNNVCVRDVLSAVQTKNIADLPGYKAGNLGEDRSGQVGSSIRELYYMQKGSASTYKGLQTAAECALPQRTKFRSVKKFLRKLMNCFVAFQLDFNRQVVSIFGDHSRQIQTLAASVAEETSDVRNMYAEKIEQLEQKISLQNKQIRLLQEKLDEALTETVDAAHASDVRLEEIADLWAKIEDAIKLLHECAQEQNSAHINDALVQPIGLEMKGHGEVSDDEINNKQ